jgi:hypothetical protein
MLGNALIMSRSQIYVLSGAGSAHKLTGFTTIVLYLLTRMNYETPLCKYPLTTPVQQNMEPCLSFLPSLQFKNLENNRASRGFQSRPLDFTTCTLYFFKMCWRVGTGSFCMNYKGGGGSARYLFAEILILVFLW